MLKHFVFSTFLCFSTLSCCLAETTQPNVVVILADDLGYGDLSCYGHPNFRTARIDQMAAEGARLTQFNTPTPFCAPTRASLMTGRYPFRCGMPENPAPDGGPGADALALPQSEVTLAQILRDAGYATGMVGKWHLGHHAGSLPTERGFDEYYGIPYSNDMRPVQVVEGTKVVEYPVVQTTLTERYTDRAIKFIERSKDRPFFLYFAQAMPHKPLAASEKNYKKSGHGLYADVMLDLDTSVGRVLDALKTAGVDDRTLVLFSSDNGAWFGGSTGGLRGMKGSNFEGGHRVPMIARWPGKIPAGHVSHQLSIMMDLFATILNATNTKLSDQRIIDGKDIMPLLTSDAESPHSTIFGLKGGRIATIRDMRWKLHITPATIAIARPGPDGKWVDSRAPDGVTILAPFEQYNLDAYPGVITGDQPQSMQLFDLKNDPSEQHDVSSDFPAEATRLNASFKKIEREFPGIQKSESIRTKKQS